MCNFCKLENIKKNKKSDMKIWIMGCTIMGGLGGIDVLIVPKNIKREDVIKNRDKYFKCWLREISESCYCYD